MKKLLLSSLILLMFSCSILLFQISCQKNSLAKTTNTSGVSKILYGKFIGSTHEIWTANSDGTNQQQAQITLPPNKVISNGTISLTSDGTKIVIMLEDSVLGGNELYTCDLDGSNLTKVVANTHAGEWYAINIY